jgi:hypothetical protein
MAILAIAAVVCIVLPVGLGVLIGTLLAFTLYHPSKVLIRQTLAWPSPRCGSTSARDVSVWGSAERGVWGQVRHR